jgi:hypothetical protein
MSHILDLSGAHEALFQLRHLAFGSRELCRRQPLHFGDDDFTPDEWDAYQGQLHFLVSRALINSAINFRVLQDTLRSQSGEKSLTEAEIDLALTSDLKLGDVIDGGFELTLRESCNKIIHTTRFDLLFSESRTGKPSRWYSYWNGDVRALGIQGTRRWELVLDVPNWCDAIDAYFECLSGDLEWR